MKTCTKCQRLLPAGAFLSQGQRGLTNSCALCINDDRRLRTPLPAIPRDPVQIRINNTFNLWHGPVSRVLLRSHA